MKENERQLSQIWQYGNGETRLVAPVPEGYHVVGVTDVNGDHIVYGMNEDATQYALTVDQKRLPYQVHCQNGSPENTCDVVVSQTDVNNVPRVY
jgi:hypothetical protein